MKEARQALRRYRLAKSLSMSITVVCPACGGKLSAPSQLIGRMAKCPQCAKAIKVVPSADSPSPAPVCQPASAPSLRRDEPEKPAAQKQVTATKGQTSLPSRRLGLPVAGSIVTLAAVAAGEMWWGRPGPVLGTAGKQEELNPVTTLTETGRSHAA